MTPTFFDSEGGAVSHLYLCPSSGPGTLRVSIIGRVDRQTADAFTASLSLMLRDCDPCPTTVVVNLRCCTAMDLDGLTALEHMRDAMNDAGGTLRLENVPPLLEHLVRHPSGQPAPSPGSHGARWVHTGNEAPARRPGG